MLPKNESVRRVQEDCGAGYKHARTDHEVSEVVGILSKDIQPHQELGVFSLRNSHEFLDDRKQKTDRI